MSTDLHLKSKIRVPLGGLLLKQFLQYTLEGKTVLWISYLFAGYDCILK